jgi:hypothetical protein
MKTTRTYKFDEQNTKDMIRVAEEHHLLPTQGDIEIRKMIILEISHHLDEWTNKWNVDSKMVVSGPSVLCIPSGSFVLNAFQKDSDLDM